MGISRSPDRFSFQRDGYIKRQEEKNEPVDPETIEYLFNRPRAEADHKFDSPESRANSLEYDLLTTPWILEKARACKSYAQNLYAVMCNRDFQKLSVVPILKEQRWSCSWRYAGGIIADMRQEGDYIDWYCSGIAGGDEPDTYLEAHDLKRRGYVPEGTATEEIREDLKKLGWIVLDD